MEQIRWGIIGCGDVTEVKSGPAFNKVANSTLVAVMRRDEAKVRDYATRHNVPNWYTDATSLINDPTVNAIYVATPPSSHEAYTIAALNAGKPVYVEKPMSVDAAAAQRMTQAAIDNRQLLTVAHYRRAQPLYQKVKELIDTKVIGESRTIQIMLTRKLISDPGKGWRVNSEIAGGGLFHDLAPHQLDILYHIFGEPLRVEGMATNQAGTYSAPDVVSGTAVFQENIQFNGTWTFNLQSDRDNDVCEITGDKGAILFSFFGPTAIQLSIGDTREVISFDALPHVQQPMIEQVVKFFRGERANPCTGEEGVAVMKMIDAMSKVTL